MWHCNLEALFRISTWSEWKSSPVRNVFSVGFPKWLSDKECLQCRRPGFDPWVGKILEEGNGHPLQDSWGNPMDREAWRATAHGGPKSWTRLSDKTTITNATGTSINKPFTILKSASWHKIEFVEIPIFVGQNLEQLQTQAWLVWSNTFSASIIGLILNISNTSFPYKLWWF